MRWFSLLFALLLIGPAQGQPPAPGPWVIHVWEVPRNAEAPVVLDPVTTPPVVVILTLETTKPACDARRENDYGFGFDSASRIVVTRCHRGASD